MTITLPPSLLVAASSSARSIATRRAGQGVLCLVAACCIGAQAALAHAPSYEANETWGTAWSWDPWVLAPFALSAVLYAAGHRRLRARAEAGLAIHRQRAALFWSGWAVVLIAMVSPIDSLGGRLFSVHMVQHELLMLLAAPLLVLSSPGGAFAWSLPEAVRRRAGPALRGPRAAWRLVTRPLAAWTIHAVVLWGWHVPVLFGAALRNDALHALQHLSFVLAALVFWWSLVRGPGGYGLAMLSVFTTAVHSSALGAFLTFSPTVWYAEYVHAAATGILTPLEDQQIGGLIMWVPGGVVYLLACLWFLSLWLRQAETSAADAKSAQSSSRWRFPAL